MLLSKEQRAAIENLATVFFESSDDLVFVASAIEDVIERRRNKIKANEKLDAAYSAEFNERVRRSHF